MEEMNKAYATFEERDRIASLGGGVDKIEKQHESGKMTARERIEMLLDKGTFVELDKLMVHRCTNYGMDKNKIPGDGIVSGYGKVDGRQVFVYAYDFIVYSGRYRKPFRLCGYFLSEHNGQRCDSTDFGHPGSLCRRRLLLSCPYRFHLYGERKKSHVRDWSGCSKNRDS